METETKPKIDVRKVLITLALVLFAAGLTGGGVYYVLNQNFKKEREANEVALNALKEKTQSESKSESTNSSTTNPTQDPSAKVVMNIRNVDFSKEISMSEGMGNWQTTLYADLTGDGKEEAVPWFKYDGTGGIADVYIYSYQGDDLKRLYYNKGLNRGKAFLVKENGKDYLKIDWANLTSTVNAGKPNSDLVVDMHQYIVWHDPAFYEQEAL